MPQRMKLSSNWDILLQMFLGVTFYFIIAYLWPDFVKDLINSLALITLSLLIVGKLLSYLISGVIRYLLKQLRNQV